MELGSCTVVFLHHGIGDLIMALPVLRALERQAPPDHQIFAFVKSRLEAEIIGLAGCGANITVQVLDRKKILRALLWLRRKKPDIFLTPQATNDWRMPLVARVIGARLSVGPKSRWAFLGYNRMVTLPEKIHKIDYYLKFVSAVGLPTPEKPDILIELPSIVLKESVKTVSAWDTDKTWIAFAPGTGQAESYKRWPVPHYIALGKRLLEYSEHHNLLVLGNPSEHALLLEIQKGVDAGKRCVMMASENISHSFGLLAQCTCLVCACAGPAHMAAAVGTPIVGLYGPTNPGFTGPYSDNFRVVNKGLTCSPCYRQGFITGCGQPICMSNISPDKVFLAVLQTLNGQFCPPIPWMATTSANKPAFPEAH